MPLPDVRLSLLAFPQKWSDNTLQARVLLLPTGDPRVSPGFGLSAFAGTAWPLRVTVLSNPDDLLGIDPATAVGAVSFTFTATPPPNAATLFHAINTELQPQVPASPADANRRKAAASARIMKHLPESYTKSFAFERPRANTTVGNEFGCALREITPAVEGDPKPPDPMTWGAVLSFALRQPLLARALGLIYDIPFPSGVPTALTEGGWLYVSLDPAGMIGSFNANAVRSYASRLPALENGATRALFAAVLLPVGLTTSGDYDEPLTEAALYSDGFARIMHANQAVTADAASNGHNELRPATDAGVDLGWDDEQVTLWMNRQLDALRARLDPAAPKVAEAPLGVAGYRIDVRSPDQAQLAAWTSLCFAQSANAEGEPASLVFPPAPNEAVFSKTFDDELTVEVISARSIHAPAGAAAWLPQYFTRWLSGSLVVNDLTLLKLSGESPLDAKKVPISVPPSPYVAADPATLPLRYGSRYEFRCRLADLTGGGPTFEDAPVKATLTSTTALHFLRHVPPKTARLKTNVAIAAPGDPTPAVSRLTSIDVWRPLIGFPEMMFAGIDSPAIRAALIARADAARAKGEAVGVNDPEVTHFRVAVQVRSTAHDTALMQGRDGEFRTLYTVDIPFPAFNSANVLDPETPVSLTLDYIDIADIATIVHPAPSTTNLQLPAARDVRLRIMPFCEDKPNYFGANWVRDGLTSSVATRADAVNEANLFVARAREQELNAIYLQPAPDITTRLADQLKLAANGLKLTARAGERVIFGASAGLRHSMSADHSSITFASETELLGRWLIAIQLDLARDWTWDGLAEEGFVAYRRDAPSADERVVGRLPVPFVASPQAVSGNGTPGVDRRVTSRLLFFDVVDPNPSPGAFPNLQSPQWRIEPRLRGFSAARNAAASKSLDIRLPVACPPRQMPKLLAAGIALSRYECSDDYSSTSPRKRVLWFELDAPVEDPHDVLFARILSYGPDPLLSGAITHKLVPVPDFPLAGTTLFEIVAKSLPNPPDPPPLAIDDELMRVIVPDQPEDRSGLDAMVEMTEGLRGPGDARARHFIVPLPPGVAEDSPELFGFWTYELRIGHKAVWSTARARFGRPLVVQGVQHPAPSLSCSAFRHTPENQRPSIVVTAPYATAVFNDQRLTDPAQRDPRTHIWVLLYAQVTQADGASRRNVLLTRAPARPRYEMDVAGALIAPRTRDVIGVAQFDANAVQALLAQLALPAETPLSVVAIELLPGDGLIYDPQVLPQVGPFETATGGVTTYHVTDRAVGSGTPDDLAGATFFRPSGSDPLGRDLASMASRRILRCSPLTPVAPSC